MPGTFPIDIDEALAGQVGPSCSPADRSLFLESYEDHAAESQIKGLFLVAVQGEAKNASEALRLFRELPENVIDEAYGKGDLEQPIIDLLVREHHGHTKFLSKLLLRDQLSEAAFRYLVLHGSDQAIDTIRRRNMNLLNSPVVLDLLFENQRVRKTTLDRILQVLGMEVEVPEDDEDEAPIQAAGETAEEIEVPIVDVEGGSEVFSADAFRSFLEGAVFDFAAELMEERDEGQQLDDQERESLFHQVMKMKVAQKISLAIKGNREARTLLLRDSNRLIPLYVLQNKGMTADEVAQVASNPTVSRDLITEIARNREFTRSYKVRRALATNPKTPLSQAMRYLSMLNMKDIRDVARSKNVPTAMATLAKNMLKRKQDQGSLH